MAATSTTTPGLLEVLKGVSAADRLRALQELVKLCYKDGNLDQPLHISASDSLFRACIVPMFTVPSAEPPAYTPEEEAEIQRRIANRGNAISHEEFVQRVRRFIREHKSD